MESEFSDTLLHRMNTPSGPFINSRSHQRISCLEAWKSREIAIRRPEFLNPVPQTERGNPGVVNSRTPDLSLHRKVSKLIQIGTVLTKKLKVAGGSPGIDASEGLGKGCGLLENLGMRHDRNILMHTGPGNRPRDDSLPQFVDHGVSHRMPGTFPSVRVDKDVRGARCARNQRRALRQFYWQYQEPI